MSLTSSSLNMIKLFLILTASGAICFGILHLSGGLLAPVFISALGAFVTITMLLGALSFALYNYLDGITKELPKKLLKESPDRYQSALRALGDLKREVISNIILVIALLLSERVLSGTQEALNGGDWELCAWVDWAVISARTACLTAGIYAALTQFRGFLTANEMRTVMMSYKD